MPDDAHNGILDRNLFRELIRVPFGPQMELLDQLVNYGTNLIPRCYESSVKGIPDAVTIGSFLKHAVTVLDAISILAKEGATWSCLPHLRSLFEIDLYLRWVFKEDFERRTTAYFVWELRRKRYWLRCYLHGTPEQLAHTEHMKGSLGENIAPPHSQAELAKAIAHEDKRLDAVEVAAINSMFDRMAKNSGNDLEWFAPFGPRSIRALAESLGEGGNYKVFYSHFSNVSHGLSFPQQLHFKASERQLIFDHIRTVDSLDQVLRLTFTFTIKIYREVLAHYRHGELDAFSRKYSGEWSSAIHSIPKVQKESNKFTITPKGQ
jgi:hypothetical protein